LTIPATGELVRTLAGAAAFVDRVGLALVFPKEGVALPSLYEAVAGASPARVADEADELGDGNPWHTPEMSMVWRWKDELGQVGLACAGKHVRGAPSLVSLRLLPSLYALTGRSGAADDFRDAVLPPLERDVAEAVLDAAPADSRDIRRAVGRRDTATVNRAIDSLQRRLVITRAGTVERDRGWPGSTYDILARRHRLGRLPPPDDAVAEVAAAVLDIAGELSVADLSRVLGTSRAESAAALERLAADGRAMVHRDGRAAVWRSVASRRGRAR
jgi:hypothetical protein